MDGSTLVRMRGPTNLVTVRRAVLVEELHPLKRIVPIHLDLLALIVLRMRHVLAQVPQRVKHHVSDPEGRGARLVKVRSSYLTTKSGTDAVTSKAPSAYGRKHGERKGNSGFQFFLVFLSLFRSTRVPDLASLLTIESFWCVIWAEA